ncbi:TPA: hypothetical protein ACGW3M_000970 [Pseudomonas aeruginosa]|nr:hypothetical protein [Pseudomonas aeruginosa]ELJ2276212.1 hypothetical protein [Pseudomonas aeruginosa]
MKKVSILALTLIGCVFQAHAASKVETQASLPGGIAKLEPGDLITATFVSKDALRGVRAGGVEVMAVQGEGGCKLIVTTEVTNDGLEELSAGSGGMPPTTKNPAANVLPRLLTCKGFNKALMVESNLSRARAHVGSSAESTLEFIVIQPIRKPASDDLAYNN